MHLINLIFAFQISVIIFATQFSESNAKGKSLATNVYKKLFYLKKIHFPYFILAFINPFNVAIQTKFTEDGNVCEYHVKMQCAILF